MSGEAWSWKADDGRAIVYDENGLEVARCGVEDVEVIAAAPDLLEAAEFMRDSWGHNLTEAMRKLNAAIAKAGR